jgi:hypothetical protein
MLKLDVPLCFLISKGVKPVNTDLLSCVNGVLFSNGSTAPWGPRSPHFFSRLHDHTF